jgi:hypothetical protein
MWVFVTDTVYTADCMITNCTDITGPLISYTTTFLTVYVVQCSRNVMWVFVMDTLYTADCMITNCTDITGPLIRYTTVWVVMMDTFCTVYMSKCGGLYTGYVVVQHGGPLIWNKLIRSYSDRHIQTNVQLEDKIFINIFMIVTMLVFI